MRMPTTSLVLLMLTQATISGSWRTEFDVGIRVVNGVESSESKGHARISLQLKADSVLGTWQTLDPAGAAMGEPRPMRGIATPGGARIETVIPRDVVLRTPDGEQRIPSRIFYVLTLRGDSLVGTEQWVALDHSTRGPTRPFTATRERQ